MEKSILFNESDQIKNNSALKNRNKRIKHRITIEYIIRKWENTISRICNGYEHFIFESYLNDLSRRDMIEEIINAGCENTEFLNWVIKMDTLFIEHTNPTKTPFYEDKSDWWWYRYPKTINENFYYALAYYGHITPDQSEI